ncbi:hypothetical protein GCK72_017868 [Caenorhabditis remanei]|uniref:Uncharacterized protein n=1 Tax=Caenorhabditis remanei TaxID=31234 RepID=A0A6A5G9L1_CAERE|nr:hypothetical protein GCK72_017868 [Caenorhabditis remanei]KAF1751314.1 hypothetical protein GCK72_017868 [Caenorhabditis remanei]
MKIDQIDTPQCYMSAGGKGTKLLIECFCSRAFFAGCLSSGAMAEALYQWRRDHESTVDEHTKDVNLEFENKVDCILKGFQKYQLRIGNFAPAQKLWDITCKDNAIMEVKTTQSLPLKPLAKNTRLAIDLRCGKQGKALPTVYCSEDYCHNEEVHVTENTLIPLRTYSLIMRSIRNGKSIQSGCKQSTSLQETQCVLTAFHSIVENFLYQNGTQRTAPPSVIQIGMSRAKLKTNQSEPETSLKSIISWLFGLAYFISFFFMCIIPLCSCGNEHRNELGHFLNPNLKDIEEILLADAHKNEKPIFPVKNLDEPKQEIIDVAVTTNSQMGNITDLGSEGPTGPGGGSIKSLKKDLKSGEDGKDLSADAAV